MHQLAPLRTVPEFRMSEIRAMVWRMKIKPCNDWIVIKRNEALDVTPGGIHVPDAAKQKALTGEVLAVGPGALRKDGTRDPVDVRPGDVVSFPHFHGEPVTLDGEELLMIRESELFGIVG